MAISGSVTFCGYPNLLGSTSVGSEASSDLAKENMESTVLSKRWRSSGLRHVDLALTGNVSSSKSTAGGGTMESVSLVNHNLSLGAHWRVRVNGGTTTPDTIEELVPTSLVDSNSMTGTYTDVDEGYAATPDGNWMSSSGGTPIYAHYGFASTSADLLTGGKCQECLVYVKTSSAIVVGFELHESGVKRYDSGRQDVTSASGEWVRFLWDADDLVTSDAKGSNVEFLIYYISGAGNFEIGSVVWNASVVDSAADYDSGLLSTYDSFLSTDSDYEYNYQATDIGISRPVLNHILDPSGVAQTSGAGRVYVELFDENFTDTPAPSSRPYEHMNPDAFAEVGYFNVSPILVPSINAEFAHISVNEWGKRVFNVALRQIPRTEMVQSFFLQAAITTGVAHNVVRTESGGTFVRGRGGPLWIVRLEPNETDMQTLQIMYCRLSSKPEFRDVGAQRMNVILILEEW